MDNAVNASKGEGTRMTLTQARIWIRKYDEAYMTDETWPCKYGHLNCSVRNGGTCLDETLTNFPQLEEE